MQLDKFKLSIVAAVILSSGLTHALVKGPEAVVSSAQADASGRQLVDLTKGPITPQATSIKVGYESSSKKEEGTLRQAFELQREAYMAELKNKVKGGQDDGNATARAAKDGVSFLPSSPVVNGAMGSNGAPQGGASGVFPTMLPALPGSMGPGMLPTDKSLPTVASIFVYGSKARADVFFDGQMRSVKVGDAFVGWTISSIEPGSVYISKKEMTLKDTGHSEMNTSSATRSSAGSKGRRGSGVIAQAPKNYVEVEVTRKLLPYKADMSASAVVNLPHVDVPPIPPVKMMSPPAKYPDSSVFNSMPSLPSQPSVSPL